MVINNKYDIFTVSELWLDSTTCDADILILEYTTFRQDQGLHKRGGGLLVYVKSIYKASVVEKWSSMSVSNFQQLWLNVQYEKFKSFLLCTVYRLPDAPIDFLEGLSETFVDSLLHGLNVLILGDLNCNVLGTTDPDGCALINFCSTFGLTQLVKTPTRVTENSKSLIDVALTTNENMIYACDVIQSAISDHSLVSLTLGFETPRPRSIFVTTRSYKNYDRNGFIDDSANVPFHIVDLFDDPDDQVNAFNHLFLQVLDEHAPIKQIRIKSRPNPFITPEIKGLMNMRDMWHKKAMKTNNKLHWNAYRFFCQEVKREIKLAEKEHARSEILKSSGNSNLVWKILNRCLPKKNAPLAAIANPLLLANKFNEFYANVGKVTALKAANLAEQHNLNI